MQIAVDDFGTGYSSLEHLRRSDRQREDRPLVRPRTPGELRDVAIVGAVIELGHAQPVRGREGVETSDLGNLQNAGCDTPGILFSRPEHRT